MVDMLMLCDDAFLLQQSQRLFHYLPLFPHPPSGDASCAVFGLRVVTEVIQNGDRRTIYTVIVFRLLQDRRMQIVF